MINDILYAYNNITSERSLLLLLSTVDVCDCALLSLQEFSLFDMLDLLIYLPIKYPSIQGAFVEKIKMPDN